jgi:sensor histidine kinase regulating citrate/malate metabolism
VETLTDEVESLKQQQDKEQSVKGVKLLFNFDKIRKKDVLVWIIEMIEKKGFESTIEKLIEFLAIFTNLGSKDTIRTQLYDYKRHF